MSLKFPEGKEFKRAKLSSLTKGELVEVENRINIGKKPNRHWNDEKTIEDRKVANGEKTGFPYDRVKLPKFNLISEKFENPQLNKTRKIWLYCLRLRTKWGIYPVLYLQNAQNLLQRKCWFGIGRSNKKLCCHVPITGLGRSSYAVEHANRKRFTRI